MLRMLLIRAAKSRFITTVMFTLVLSIPPATLTQGDEPSKVSATQRATTTRPVATQSLKPKAPGTVPLQGESEPHQEQPEGEIGDTDRSNHNIRFQFDGIPYNEVIRRFAQMARRPLIGDLNVPGMLTFYDSELYTYDEAIDTLNVILSMRGYRLIESGRFLRLIPQDQIRKMLLPFVPDADKLGELRPGQVVTVIIPLKHLGPNEGQEAIKGLLSVYGSIAPLVKGKGLIVTDRTENIERMRSFLRILDTETLIEQEFKSHPLKYASARSVAETVNKLFGPGGPKRLIHDAKRGTYVERARDPKDNVRTIFDEQANTLMLIGTPDRIAMAEQLIEKLDTAGEEDGGDFRIFQLENTNAEELGKTILAAIPEKQVGYDKRRKRPIMASTVKIIPDKISNRLIVSAPMDQMSRIEMLIRELDKDSSIAGSARIFPLKAADAKQLSTIVHNSVVKVDSKGRTQKTVVVLPDARTNSLIITGPEEYMRVAAALIDELDREDETPARDVHVVQIKTGDASQLAGSLTRIFSEQIGKRRRGTPPNSKLRIETQKGTNTLLIVCSPDEWTTVESILKQLDATSHLSNVPSTRMVSLKFAKASELAKTLQQIFGANSRKGSRNRKQSNIGAVIAPNDRTNSLLISATGDDQETIAALIASMDVPSAEKIDPIRIIRLSSADAKKVAETLKGLLPPVPRGQVPKVFVYGDVTTNSVLIRGPADEQKMLEEMIAALDAATREQARETRLIQLQHASATAIASTLTQIYQKSPAPARRRKKTQEQTDDTDRVTIAPAPGDRALIIDAPRDKIEEIVQLALSLDTRDALGRTEIRTYKLTGGDPKEIAQSLGRIFGTQQSRKSRNQKESKSPPRFEADSASKQLIVSATPAQFEEIDKLIEKLKTGTTLSERTQIFQLRYARAEEIIPMLQQMLSDAPGAPKKRGRSPARGNSPRVAGVPGANSIVIQGPPDKLALGEELIRQFDRLEAAPKATIHIVHLKNARAETLALAVNVALGQRSKARGRGKPQQNTFQITVTPEQNSNTLLIRGPAGEISEVIDLIKTLDAESTSAAVEVRVFPLTNSEATALSKSLEKLFRDILKQGSRKGRSAQTAPFSIAANERTNSLIISTTGAYFTIVEQLIKTLDKGEERQAMDVQYVWLDNADASEMADRLELMFSGRRKGDRPLIQADPFSNALTIIAKPSDWKTIEPIITKLDDAAKDNIKIRVIPLSGVKAKRMADILQRVYGQMSTSSIRITDKLPDRQSGPDEMLPAPSIDSEAIREESTNSRAATTNPAQTPPAIPRGVSDEGMFNPTRKPPVTIAVDEKANALIISATQRELDNIELLISQLTAADVEGDPEIRIVPVRFADPASLGKILNELFSSQKAAPPRPAGKGRGKIPYFPAPSVKQKVVIIPEVRTRSLIIRASPSEFELVELIISQLDKGSTVVSEMRIFPLKNTIADEVARNLREIFRLSSGPAPKQGKKKRKGKPQEQRANIVRQMIEISGKEGVTQVDAATMVTVTANTQSNSVVVAAPPEAMKLIEQIIQELDQSAAMANIPAVRMYPLKYADVKATVTAVKEIFSPLPSKRTRKGPIAVDRETRVRVTGDERGKLVIVSAPADKHELIAQVIADIDQASVAVAPEVYVIPLKNGDASQVAGTIDEFYKQQTAAARRNKRSIDPLSVSADTRANAIILATTPKMHAQVTEWIQKVEEMKPSRGTPRIITLEHADPAEVENAIQQIFGDGSSSGRSRQQGRRGPDHKTGTPRVETSVMPTQRAILVTANDEDYQAILQLTRSLDQGASQTRKQVRVFKLVNATNVQIATALNSMYSKAARSGVEEDRVSIAALPQTNAVVVTAVNEKIDEIAGLIKQLDAVEIAPQLEFRIYPLKNALAEKVLPTLQQMLKQIQRVRPDEPINVQADERTRSIIVTARGKVFEQVEKIIETLDKAPAEPVADVLIIPLKRADATSLAAVLNQMLRPSGTNQVTPEARALQEQIRRLRFQSTNDEDLPELDLTKPIKIHADSAQAQGSNALIIQSTPENLKAMRAIVEIMDTVPIAEGVVVRLLHLEHADATSVMQILQKVFDQGKKLAGKAGTSVAGKAVPQSTTGKALVHQFNVAADLRTNTLVVSGRQESVALAELLVRDLDRNSGIIVTDVRVFRLKHASAERILPVLQAVFAEATPTPGAEGLRTHVTRLRTAIKKNRKHTTKLAKARSALTIQADPATNMLVVAARSDVIPLIADVIHTMDIPGAGSLNRVQIFPLYNADASRIGQILDELHAGPNAKLIRDEDKPTISTDIRTNSLIVSTSDKTFAMIGVLLKHLDAKEAIDLLAIHLIPLDNTEAAPLATTLQKMVDARVQRQSALGLKDAESLRVLILPDERSNSLIVGGSLESFKLVEQLVQKLDGASPAIGGQIQVLPLSEANAGTLAQMLSDLFDQRYQAVRTAEVQRQKPIIVPDLRANLLLVAANKDDTAVLKSLLEKLDVKLTDPAVRLVVIPLKHNDAGVVGPMIQSIFEARLQSMTPSGQTPSPQDRVDVVSDALSNALVVSASRENMDLIGGLLAKVDVEPPAKTGIVRMYPLVNSDAQRIATMLEGLFSKGLYKPGLSVAGASPALQSREKVAITADIRTNVLIVSASRENFAVIDEVIKRIDATEDFGALGDVRLFQLNRADATRLAPTLQKFFDSKRAAEQQSGSSGRSVPVNIIPDARTNTLLVAGSRESFKTVEAMIERLDGGEAIPAGEFRIFYLKEATAGAIQPMLQNLFDQRVTRGQTKDTVTIVAETKTNALIVGAKPEDMKLVESLIARLDTGSPAPGTSVQVFPLVRADASQAAETIRNLYQSQGVPAAGIPGISVDERINAIVISGGEADMRLVENLIEQLDSEAVTRITEIRIFTLENADAVELAEILTESLTNKPKSMTAVSPNRQQILRFITHSSDGRELIASALQEGVLITPDRRTNSLVVSAPVRFMPLLERLVGALDSIAPPMTEIRIFTLVNADAQRMADVLSELFRLKQTNPEQIRSVSYSLATGNSDEGEGTSATMGTVEQHALSVTVDVRTNSLLVGGTKGYVELCENLIQELDSHPAQERIFKVYHLRNAQAGDIETALNSFLDQERTRLTGTLGTDGIGAAQRLLEREVAVVSVGSEGESTNSNTLLLSASPRYFETIDEMIRELDQPPPQVLIQVLLAEIALADTTDFGIDWNLTATSGSSRIATSTNFGIKAGIGKSGFNLAISTGDLEFFLRALQAQGRLEVLSRPQILASDNQEASIEIGESVPFIRDSRITDTGTTLNTIQYEPVGILLSVTPRINPDGFVRLEVKPEISSVSDSTVQISEGVNAIIIEKRTAETTVTVQDGQTIIIGGLIRTKDQERVDKVPILGDIPGLGWLFKSVKTVKERTELLIILTPHILRNVADADAETGRQFSELNLLGEMGTEDVLKRKALRPITTMQKPTQNSPTTRKATTRRRLMPLELLAPLTKERSLN